MTSMFSHPFSPILSAISAGVRLPPRRPTKKQPVPTGRAANPPVQPAPPSAEGSRPPPLLHTLQSESVTSATAAPLFRDISVV